MFICEGICFFAGLYFLFSGRVKLWGRKTIRGQKARLMGFLLLVPIPVALIAAFLLAPSASTDEEMFQAILTASSIELIAIIVVLFAVAYIYIKAPDSSEPEVIGPVKAATFSGGGFGVSSGILTVPEAAQYLRVTEAEILNMIDTGKLAAAKIGNEYRISKSVIDDMLKNR